MGGRTWNARLSKGSTGSLAPRVANVSMRRMPVRQDPSLAYSQPDVLLQRIPRRPWRFPGEKGVRRNRTISMAWVGVLTRTGDRDTLKIVFSHPCRTRRNCILGDPGHTQLCTDTSCSLCSIVRDSYHVDPIGKGLGWTRLVVFLFE